MMIGSHGNSNGHGSLISTATNGVTGLLGNIFGSKTK